MIGSLAMALRYSFGLLEAADQLEGAITRTLAAGVGVTVSRPSEISARQRLQLAHDGVAHLGRADRVVANPIAMIGSLAMALRYSFGLLEAADQLEGAITRTRARRRAACRANRSASRPRPTGCRRTGCR
jgi:isocitrate/isopropylmalate dehydrogenase